MGGSDGVDHVAIEVLQHDVANRGLPPGPHRIFHPPSFGGACLNFSRGKDSAVPFPRRP